jgi:hypothetical protein
MVAPGLGKGRISARSGSMSFYRIRLELARSPEFPEGAPNRGYEIKAPLSEEGHLDEAAWRTAKDFCTVRRFWQGEPDQEGRLIHTRHRDWAVSYAPGEDDDEPVFHLETHRIAPGEYISIREREGDTETFRIAQVTPLKVH